MRSTKDVSFKVLLTRFSGFVGIRKARLMQRSIFLVAGELSIGKWSGNKLFNQPNVRNEFRPKYELEIDDYPIVVAKRIKTSNG